MNRRAFLRLLGLAPIAAPVAAAGMAQAGTFATGGVVAGRPFIFGEMTTGSFLPLSADLVHRTAYAHRIHVASYADLLATDAELGAIAVVSDETPGPIRPVIAPDEAQRSEAFSGLVEQGAIKAQSQ